MLAKSLHASTRSVSPIQIWLKREVETRSRKSKIRQCRAVWQSRSTKPKIRPKSLHASTHPDLVETQAESHWALLGHLAGSVREDGVQLADAAFNIPAAHRVAKPVQHLQEGLAKAPRVKRKHGFDLVLCLHGLHGLHGLHRLHCRMISMLMLLLMLLLMMLSSADADDAVKC